MSRKSHLFTRLDEGVGFARLVLNTHYKSLILLQFLSARVQLGYIYLIVSLQYFVA